MNTKSIKELLAQEMENKKAYPANYETECDECGKTIEEGEEFVFMGSKQKICNECQGDITNFLEDN